MEYLIAVDLEGIGGVVGSPNCTLTESFDYRVATENAVLEINAAVSALFDSGADRVSVWDNHGGGNNIDFGQVDARAEKITVPSGDYRFDFALSHKYDGVIYLGYHSREGTFSGVLAHTYNSKAVQYAKINGVEVGELEIDSYIAATHGISPLLLASDKACVEQFAASSPETVFVTTKYGTGRNSAELRPEEEILKEIYDGVKAALGKKIPPLSIEAPVLLEVRYTRAESAEELYNAAKEDSGIEWVKYGSDTHTLIYKVTRLNRIPHFI